MFKSVNGRVRPNPITDPMTCADDWKVAELASIDSSLRHRSRPSFAAAGVGVTRSSNTSRLSS